VLDRLKHQSDTRHIPVQIISVDDERQRGLKMGAFAYLEKPATKESIEKALGKIKELVERPVGKLLVVEDNEVQRNSIKELVGNGDTVTTAVGTAEEALAALEKEKFDCMVLDLGLPDMNGLELIKLIREKEEISELPIIVYTGRELSQDEQTELKRLAETVIVKTAASPERLLDETALFLHRLEEKLPQEKQQILKQLHEKDPVLRGRKVLIVDDDVRNIFALTSLLEHHEMEVLYAENGKVGLQKLKEAPDVDVILMDIMMPEMDGYEATRIIRDMEQFQSLPIIALTAKAMKGDREKCIEAGTSDYIVKPVESEQLLSLLRVWLYNTEQRRPPAGSPAPIVSILGGEETSLPSAQAPATSE